MRSLHTPLPAPQVQSIQRVNIPQTQKGRSGSSVRGAPFLHNQLLSRHRCSPSALDDESHTLKCSQYMLDHLFRLSYLSRLFNETEMKIPHLRSRDLCRWVLICFVELRDDVCFPLAACTWRVEGFDELSTSGFDSRRCCSVVLTSAAVTFKVPRSAISCWMLL